MSSLGAETPVPDQPQPRTASFTFFFPLIMGIATPAPLPEEGENRTVLPQGLMLINPFTGSLMMVSGNLEPPVKEGPLPASKASTEAMPAVEVTEEGMECAICLSEFEVGGEAKEMPCKHRYHSECIEKWLGIRGTCPVCRYRMPEEEGGENKERSEGETRGRRGEGEVQISFFFGGGGGGERVQSNSGWASDQVGDSLTAEGRSDGGATNNMEPGSC